MPSAIGSAINWLYATVTAGVKAVGFTGTAQQIVTGLVIGGTASALLGKPRQTSFSTLAQQGQNVLGNSVSNTNPIPVIYGERLIGGTRTFVSTSDKYNHLTNELEKTNGYLHMVLTVCEGEIEEFTKVYANNIEIYPNPDVKFRNKVKVNVHLGADDQIADDDLVSSFFQSATVDLDNNFRGRGVAYVYVRLEHNTDVWQSGIPTITAKIKGKKVEDIRQTVSGGANINRYSTNPALCIRDYLTNTTYGRGISSSNIDATSFTAAANYCDTSTSYTMADASTVTQKRYQMNGMVSIGETSMNILEDMLTSCRGMIVFSGGKYKLILDKDETPALTFSEDDMLPDFEVTLGGKDSFSNRVNAQFFNPEKDSQLDFVYVESSTYKTADNDLLLERNIELPFTNNYVTAKDIGEQTLKQSRQNIIIRFSTFQQGLLAECGDVIYIKNTNLGWDTLNSNNGKKFRVMDMQILSNGEINIIAVEFDSAVYTPSTIPLEDTAPNTNLPDITNSEAVSLSSINITDDLYFDGAKIVPQVTISWGAPNNDVDHYNIWYNQPPNFQTVKRATSSTRSYIIDNIGDGYYVFWIQAVNQAGYKSEATGVHHVAKGIDALPAVNSPAISSITESLVSTFDGSGVKAQASVAFTASSNSEWEDLGVTIDHYEASYASTSTPTVYTTLASTGTTINFVDIKPDRYNFRVRAINTAGISSDYNMSTQTISGLTTAPANVTNFYLRADSSEAHLHWDQATDLDVKIGGSFEIRHSPLTSSASWDASSKIGNNISGISTNTTMPLMVGTYLIKAVDSTGNKSATATTHVNSVSPSMFDKQTLTTITDTTFAGSKTNMVVDGSVLKFQADTLWDSITENIDEWGLVDSIGGLDTSGSYEFASKIDATQVSNVLLSSSITFTTVDASAGFWDDQLSNIDTWQSIDSTSDFDDINAYLYVATTNDDPADGAASWSSYQLLSIGNYYARGFKFKLEASTSSTDHQINISQLVAKAEAFYRNESATSSVGTGGSTITYSNAFYATPTLAISADNMATGDYYTISATSKTAFTIRFYNSSGSGVARTMQYIARGY